MESLDAASAFSAISQATRLDALRALVRSGPSGLPAGDLAELTGASPSTLTFHLKELLGAGLVHSRRDGRNIIYAADYGGLRELVDFLMADCCQGDPRLCGPYVIKETSA